MSARGKNRSVNSSRSRLNKTYIRELSQYLAKAKCYMMGPPKILGKCYMRIIEIYTDIANFHMALHFGQKHLALAQAGRDRIDELRVINSIGRIHLLQGQCSIDPEKAKLAFNAAEIVFNTGIELCSSLRDEIKNPESLNMKARLFLNISIVQARLGHTDMALENVRRATVICHSESLLDVLYQCHYNEARFLKKKEDYLTALSCCHKALGVVKKLKDEAWQYDTLCLEAKILCKLSDYKKAKNTYLKAYKLNSKLQIDTNDLGSNLKAAAAMCYTRDLLTEFNTSGSENHFAFKILYETLGDGACHFKNYGDAVNHYKKSLEHARRASVNEKSLIPIYVSLYQTYKDMGCYEEALSYFREEYKLVKEEPKEAYSTLINYAETLFLAKKSYDEIEKICLVARCDAKRMNDKNFEIKILKLLLKYQRKYKTTNQIAQTINDLKLLGCDKDFDNLEDDQSSLGGCEDTKHFWDDVCLEDLTDTSDEELNESILRNMGKSYTVKRNAQGETTLHLAMRSGRIRQVKSLLAKGHPVNVRDNVGYTPLHKAALAGHMDITKLLIKYRANVNDVGSPDCDGITPLHCACSYGYLKIVILLLQNGADPSLKTNSGKLPKDLLQEWRSREELSEKEVTLYNIILDNIIENIDEGTAETAVTQLN